MLRLSETRILDGLVQAAFIVFITRWGLGVPLIAGFIVSLVWDFGSHLDPAVFSTVAQIAPVFLVAMLISELFMVGRFVEEVGGKKAPKTAKDLSDIVVSRYLALLVAVEVPALTAAALGHSTTFLAAWMFLALVAFTFEFRRNQIAHIAISSRLSSR